MSKETSCKQWPKYRFRRAIPRIKDCLLSLGYVANEEEATAREELIWLCRKVVEETSSDLSGGFTEGYQKAEGGL